MLDLGTLARLGSALLGVWLAWAPRLLGYQEAGPRTNDLALGVAVMIFALLALGSNRLRFATTALGLVLVLTPWLARYRDSTAVINDLVVGFLVILLSLPQRSVRARVAG